MSEQRIRAVVGETVVGQDGSDAVVAATRAMLTALVAERGVDPGCIVSAVFTVTPDIAQAFPAVAARDMGWGDVPLLCAAAVPVLCAPKRCVRVLLHVAEEK
jgi:chorismate mutase